MRIKRSNLELLPVLVLVVGVASASAVAQHVHGVVELGIVVEDDTVAVSLSAPLADVVGFEHEPRNDEQARLIQQAASTLSNPEAMFGLAESANCEFSDMTIDGPGYVMKHLAREGDASTRHDDDHDDHNDHHNNDHHDHGEDHGESDHEGHSEVTASYEWKCGGASGLDTLDLRFTERFASVETIEIQILTSAGAQVLTAEGGVGSVSLSSP